MSMFADSAHLSHAECESCDDVKCSRRLTRRHEHRVEWRPIRASHFDTLVFHRTTPRNTNAFFSLATVVNRGHRSTRRPPKREREREREERTKFAAGKREGCVGRSRRSAVREKSPGTSDPRNGGRVGRKTKGIKTKKEKQEKQKSQKKKKKHKRGKNKDK